MSILAAENTFKKGLAALVDGRHPEAVACFRSAMEIEKQRSVRRPDMRYLSYYGLCVARVHGPTQDSVGACEMAARQDPTNPALLLNLGRVYFMAGRTTKALECFERGLRMAPRSRPLLNELSRTDRRGRPPLRMLSRDHALNRWIGTLRAKFRGGGRLATGRVSATP